MSKAFVINPYVIDFKAVEMDAEKAAALKEYLTKGQTVEGVTATETVLVSGDIITHLALTPELAAKRPAFAFFNSEEAPDEETGFKDTDPAFLGFTGMALLTGPKQADGTYADVTRDEAFYDARIGFKPNKNNMLSMLAQTLGLNIADIQADNENFDRSAITDEELVECGCNGCIEELNLRHATDGQKPLKKAANGSTLQ